MPKVAGSVRTSGFWAWTEAVIVMVEGGVCRDTKSECNLEYALWYFVGTGGAQCRGVRGCRRGGRREEGGGWSRAYPWRDVSRRGRLPSDELLQKCQLLLAEV